MRTTLVQMIPRLYDVDEGEVLVDGVNVKDYTQENLREGVGMVLQKIKGVYGFTSEFACPVDVTVYADPAAGITEKMFEEAIDAEELVIPAKEGEKVIPMHTVLKSYAVAGQVSREEFAQIMFRDVGIYRNEKDMGAAVEKVRELQARYKEVRVSDTGKIFNLKRVHDVFAHFNFGVNFFGVFKAYFHFGVGNFFHDDKGLKGLYCA